MNQADPLSFHSTVTAPVSPGRYRQTLDGLPLPTMLFSATGKLDFANAAARSCFAGPLAAAGAAQGCHISALSAFCIDAELFDRVLHTGSAISIELSLRGSDRKDRHYQISLTPLHDEQGQVEALLQCHQDVTLQRQDALRLQMLQGHLLEMAHRDPLTNLANRRFLELRLEKMAGETSMRQCALLFADLDQFKLINDIHGDIAGDAVLTTLAQRMRHVLRGTDLLARVGGDEFAVLLEGVTESGARAVAGKLIAALADPVEALPQPNALGVSLGVCLFKTGMEMPPNLLLQADLAMHRAKRRGGMQFELVSM